MKRICDLLFELTGSDAYDEMTLDDIHNWIRTEHNMYVAIVPQWDSDRNNFSDYWEVKAYNLKRDIHPFHWYFNFSSVGGYYGYDVAYKAGLETLLHKLIQKKNENK